MTRGRVKKSDSDINHGTYDKNAGSYFELVLRSFGETFHTKSYSHQSPQVLTQNSLYGDKKRETLFALPPNWIWCTIGDVVEMAQNLTIELELSGNSLINYVDIDAIDNKRYKLREIKQKSVKELSSRARRILKKGYVVYSLVRPYLNNLAIIEEDRENLIGTTGFAAFRCIEANNEYVKFWLLTPFIRKRYLKYMSGFNSPGISSGQFYSTPIPLPPIEEQIEIVSLIKGLEDGNFPNTKFSELDPIISRVNQVHRSQESCLKLKVELSNQLSLVKQLRQAFLREAMQGKLVPQDPNDEPAVELLKKIKAEKEQLINEKKIRKEKELPPIKPEEIPFEIPKSWVWCRLGEISTIKGGKRVPNGYKLIKTPTPHIYIRVSDMKNGSIDDSDLHYIDDTVYHGIRQYIITKEDLYMTIVGATIGKCGLVPDRFDKMNLTENAARIIRYHTDKKFLWYCLDSPFCQNQFIDKTKQMGVQKMALNRLSTSLLPLPPVHEQHRIVGKLEQLMNYCDELEQSIKQSQTQNEKLLQQVLREALQPMGNYKINELSFAAED